MTPRLLPVCLMLALLGLLRPPAAPAAVGYVNILNGVEPAQAFVVERQGQVIVPDGIYTDLEEGDVVKPSPTALLLFTPLDTACEVVEISGEFTSTACPLPAGGLSGAAYDFIADEFLAAPDESVQIFTARGDQGRRLHSLPLQALTVFVESPALADTLKKTPFVALTDDQARAEALILGQGDVQLLSPGETGGRHFQLPGEERELRQALLRRIHFKTMTELRGSSPWPAVEWNINIHAPDEEGTVVYGGRKWSAVKTVKAAEGPLGPVPVAAPCFLTFHITNRSDRPYYAYLVNYTAQGQIVPVLPPRGHAHMSNLAPAGAEFPVPGVFLELSAPREFVRLILSENPLDLSSFSQESLDEPAAGPPSSVFRLRPVPPNTWCTSTHAFEMR